MRNAYNWQIQHNVLHHTYTNIHGHDEDLDAGRTHGQVGQQPYMMGYKAMYVLKDIVDGKALKFDNPSLKAIYTGLDVCMKPNIGSCIAG